jgi:antitoxin component YwqK of YwqJK toxin-antitoxin module
MMTKVLTLLLACFISTHAISQKLDLQNRERNKAYSYRLPESIVDSTYGVMLYEKFNPLVSDSVRYCGKNPCFGIVEDYYTNDSLLHKATYSEGKLQSYKNYFPNGILEREIKMVNIYSAKMRIFYPSGKIKSSMEFINSNPIKWTDYYENGNIDYEEEYDRKYKYVLKKVSYQENGNIIEEERLIKKGKQLYTYKSYRPNGKIKLDGVKSYRTDLADYRKIGVWKHYNEDGVLIKEEKFTE